MRQAGLARLDFAISRVALGKEDRADVERRRRALDALIAAGRPELGVVVTDAQLIADIAAGYDVVVMGADKWAQVNDPAWYRVGRRTGRGARARCRACSSRPRPGFRDEPAPKCSSSTPTTARSRRPRRVPGSTTT